MPSPNLFELAERYLNQLERLEEGKKDKLRAETKIDSAQREVNVIGEQLQKLATNGEEQYAIVGYTLLIIGPTSIQQKKIIQASSALPRKALAIPENE